MLIKKYEEVMKKTPQERMLEAQRKAAAPIVTEVNMLEGEQQCQKKVKTKKTK